ncbi:hypothetical protein [Haloechinothrix halophila]|uniref:hypothetical protein n=1 Tax=Haloechinothrix halophila TaxID=1069073 RepID=UPI00054E25EE|nr:hypothetical protein [Haloechinothrix halophila]
MTVGEGLPTEPQSDALEPDTRALLSALAAINGKVPDVALALLEGRITPQRQREFAELLLELAELLRTHANNGETTDT